MADKRVHASLQRFYPLTAWPGHQVSLTTVHTVMDSLCPLVLQLVHEDGHLDHLAQHQQLRLPAPEVWFLEPLTIPASKTAPALSSAQRAAHTRGAGAWLA